MVDPAADQALTTTFVMTSLIVQSTLLCIKPHLYVHHHQSNRSFLQLASVLNKNQELAVALLYDTIVKYVDLVRCLKPTITLQEASYPPDPPETLTFPVHKFLKVCFGLSDDESKLAWAYEGANGEVDALENKYI